MSSIAYTSDKLRELDDDERRAWSTYHERIRDLDGEEYERAEDESWQELQQQLQGLERRRHSLSHRSA